MYNLFSVHLVFSNLTFFERFFTLYSFFYYLLKKKLNSHYAIIVFFYFLACMFDMF